MWALLELFQHNKEWSIIMTQSECSSRGSLILCLIEEIASARMRANSNLHLAHIYNPQN